MLHKTDSRQSAQKTARDFAINSQTKVYSIEKISEICYNAKRVNTVVLPAGAFRRPNGGQKKNKNGGKSCRKILKK